VLDISLDRERFVRILRALVAEAAHLQNNPPALIPEEDRAARIVLKELRRYSQENDGPLRVEHVAYQSGRGNVIIEYPGFTETTVAFAGSHFDVVPANREQWERDPFTLSIEGDRLYARGVTDCLGHVALLTDYFIQLAEKQPKIAPTLSAVLIANEENSEITGVGIDELVRRGRLEHLKSGPVYWLDSADTQPSIGTGGGIGWRIDVEGKLFHSGMPDKAINALELAMEVVRAIQRRFYQDFPPHPEEQRYLFATGSTLKPTQWKVPEGSLNQIPGECTVSGDIRLTPFYRIEDAMQQVERYIRELDVTRLPTLGPSRYELPTEGRRGEVRLRWLGQPNKGIACNLESRGYRVLCDAVRAIIGEVKPHSDTGGLPLVKDLQDSGFDIQITGFGREETYHAPNEFGVLSEFEAGSMILTHIINAYNEESST
jgi:acetylornithine deacetylase